MVLQVGLLLVPTGCTDDCDGSEYGTSDDRSWQYTPSGEHEPRYARAANEHYDRQRIRQHVRQRMRSHV